MARKKGRRSKPFKLNLKKDTVNSILAILIVAFAGILIISFSQQGPVLSKVFLLGSSLFGWVYILLPFLFISGGLMLTKVTWSIAKPNVFLGTTIAILSLSGLTRAGQIGYQLSLSISSLITTAGSILFYLTGVIIGAIVLFETSLEDISILLQSFTQKTVQIYQKILTLTKKTHPEPNSSLSARQMKVTGLNSSDSKPTSTSSSSPVHLPKQLSDKKLQVNQPKPLEVSNSSSNIISSSKSAKSLWTLPPLSILSDEKRGKAERGDLKANANVIERTLKSFGIDAKVVEVNCGPAVTQYAIEIALGTKLSKISALQSDLALALAAPRGQIRIEAPIPGRSLVGIEIPNRSLEFVSLKQILVSQAMKKTPSKLAVALGINVSGDPQVADISQMPHVLIAGSTGSGKSVCVNSFIASILFRATPDEVRFIMVDPKRVELTNYNDIPHLLTPVIVDSEKVVSALNWAKNEMDKRYKLFAEVGVRNISSYNNLSGFQSMHYIVIIIDELADIMLFAPSEVENLITKLAQMARAVGIHLVLSTQRPSVDVITGLIKANINARISFNVSSMVDSRVILDTPGAEKLLGRGDMLYIPPDQPKPNRIQGCFVSDTEINALIAHLKSTVQEPKYDQEVVTAYKSKTRFSFDGKPLKNLDDLFEDALRTCIDSNKASASLLQRRLSIGYARAARILDQLEEAGVISAQDGSKPREILISNIDDFLNQVTQT